jgi:type IV pilus assembly protein PilE
MNKQSIKSEYDDSFISEALATDEKLKFGKGRYLGFTLIELMIVVAVVAILAAIALPAYTNQIRKSKRTDAKTSLLDLASRQERYFTTNNAYTSTSTNLGYSGSYPVSIPSATTFNYGIDVTAASATAYTATATPNGDQTNDSCGTFQIDQLGVQSNSSNTTPTAECWR